MNIINFHPILVKLKRFSTLLFIALLWILSPTPNSVAASRAQNDLITNYDIVAQLYNDGKMQVTEDITFLIGGRDIQRGIIREFPLAWQRDDGKEFRLTYDIKDVLLDGKPIISQLEKVSSGLELKIGDPNKIIYQGRWSGEPEKHTFTITYSISNHFSRFQDWDELYFNAIGANWQFKIEKATFKLILPDAAKSLDSSGKDTRFESIEAYTGPEYAKRSDYAVMPDGSIELTTPLGRQEALTVVYTWPRGIIDESATPIESALLTQLLVPNQASLIFWYPLPICLFIFIFSRRSQKRKLKKEMEESNITFDLNTVIPLYYAPQGLTPGQLRYAESQKYDDDSFAADILHLVQRGYLKLSGVSKNEVLSISKGALDLNAPSGRDGTLLDSIEKKALEPIVTATSPTLLDQKSNKSVINARLFLEGRSKAEKNKLFSGSWIPALIISILTSISSLVMMIAGIGDEAIAMSVFSCIGFALVLRGLYTAVNRKSGIPIVACIVSIIIGSLFCLALFVVPKDIYYALPRGVLSLCIVLLVAHMCFIISLDNKRLKAKLRGNIAKGLRLYIGTAERYRYQEIYPPNEIKVRFEELLPYALALGLGKTWADTFSDYLTKSGTVPSKNVIHSSNQLVRFTRTCTYATMSPRTSSGSSGFSSSRGSGGGGGGRSGGGSGGGGGRGW